MRLKHFYLPTSLPQGGRVALPKSLQHRLSRVLRCKAGMPLVLFNGSQRAQAILADDNAREAEITAPLPAPAPLPPLHLYMGLPKREAWETILRQATELGATAITPLLTDHSVPTKLNAERAHDLLQEAAEQSERLTLPTLHPLQTVPQMLAALNQPLLWAYERHEGASPSASHAAVLVGPEGGFSASEVALLQTHPQVTPISLGPTILRADTAAIAAITRLQLLA